MPIISMSVNEQVLRKFDSAAKQRGYSTRSEAFRDAMRNFIDESEWSDEKGVNAAVLTAIYDDKKVQKGRLSVIQHSYLEIQTVLHMHIDDTNCLEIFVAKGSGEKIREIIWKIRNISGIKEIKFITTTCNV